MNNLETFFWFEIFLHGEFHNFLISFPLGMMPESGSVESDCYSVLVKTAICVQCRRKHGIWRKKVISGECATLFFVCNFFHCFVSHFAVFAEMCSYPFSQQSVLITYEIIYRRKTSIQKTNLFQCFVPHFWHDLCFK